jgi:hypothetical protein
VKVTVEVKLTPAQLAEVFCEWDDEKQAQFFIEAANIAGTWEGGGAAVQFRLVGRHLVTCACSSEGARDVVRDLAAGIEDAQRARR